MFPKIIAVKKTALAYLKNNWPEAIATVSIVLAFYLVLINLFSFSLYIFSGNIAKIILYIIFAAVIIFIGVPLIMGMLRIFWGLVSEHPLKATEIFYYFSSKNIYKKLTIFTFFMLGRITLRSIILLLPSIIIGIISKHSSLIFGGSVQPLWFSNIWIFEIVLRAIAICFIVYMVSRYYLAPFLFIADENADELGSIHKARSLSKISMSNFIGLFFSLVGWMLLSVFFVPLIFTLPYMCICYIVHCRYAVVYYNRANKKYNENSLEVVL